MTDSSSSSSSNHDSVEAMDIDTPSLSSSNSSHNIPPPPPTTHAASHKSSSNGGNIPPPPPASIAVDHNSYYPTSGVGSHYPTTTPPPPPPPAGGAYDPYYHYYYQQQQQAQQQILNGVVQQPPQQQAGGGILKDFLKLWVGNIPDNTTEQDLRDVFGTFGKVESVKLSDHCCFIQFSDTQQAATAQKIMNGEIFKGNRIKVNWASIKNKLHQSSVSGYMSTTQQPTATATGVQQQPIGGDVTVFPIVVSPPTTTSITNTVVHHHSPPPPPPPIHSHHQTPPPPPPSIHHHHPQHHTTSPPVSTQQQQQPNIIMGNISTSTFESVTITTMPNGSVLVSDSDPYVNRKLFLGVQVVQEQLKELRHIFSRYGDIEDCLVSQKGNAFLKYYKVESAILAKREFGWKYKIQYDKREGPQPPFHSSVPFIYPIPSNTTNTNSHLSSTPTHHLYNNNTTNTNTPNNKFSEPLSMEESQQFANMLENLKSTKSLIKESKDWILMHLKSGKAIIQLMIRILNNNNSNSNNKISILYLVNDILYFGSTKRKYGETTDTISNLFEPFLIPIIGTFVKDSSSSSNQINIVLNVLNIWDNKQYYNFKIINSLKSLLK